MNKPEVKCNRCVWEGNASEAEPAHSAYHALQCPKCGTSNLDTSGLNKKWADIGETYGYGDNNCLSKIRKEGK